MATEAAQSPTEYMVHHLTHNASGKMSSIVDFSVINYDTVVFSVLMLVLCLGLLYLGAKKATSGVPGKWQCAVEMVVDFVEEQSKAIVHGDHYLRPLPTADLNGTLGISVSVLVLCIYYGFKVKGAGGFVHELFTAPFGNNIFLWPFNFILNLVEYVAKTVSLGMRLFGNMYAGELLFFLIALLGGYALSFGVVGGSLSVFGQVVAGLCWWLFHILIVLLQAFIMMMLTLVYLGQAHDSH